LRSCAKLPARSSRQRPKRPIASINLNEGLKLQAGQLNSRFI
jgi:hypothetical protein